MRQETMSRREFVRAAAAVGGSSVVVDGLHPAGDQAGPLVITDPGGEWQQAAIAAYYRSFEAETRIRLRYAARPALAVGRLKAMVEARNVDWDLTILVDYLVPRAARDGLLEPIDYSLLDTATVMKPALQSHMLGNDVYATVMAYNTRRWPAGQGPRTWADFWDTNRFPGRRAMSGIGYGPLESALLADGVPADRLYPLELPRALRKMDQIKPAVKVWWTTGAQQSQLMLSNEVDLIQGWSARLQYAIDRGAPFAIEWNQGIYGIEGWVIPKGAPNRAAAHRFLAHVLRPDRQAAFAQRLSYGPVNQAALALVPPASARKLPTFEANLGRMVGPDIEWIAEHADELQARWTAWKVR